MCGVAGIWNREQQPVERQAIDAMVDSLVHRGPDGVGIYMGPGIGLGHRRLKIVDLSEAAAQPIWLPDRSLCMVYNGEIHNYIELAAELRSAGAQLRTDNDTEVLLWAYRIWGEACFERLNGMWAAAFWEPAKRTLLLSRDRFGIKPLLYLIRGQRVAFASEAKALLAAFPEEIRPNPRFAQDFVGDRLPDPDAGEGTFFENIKSLLPGHFLRIEGTRETRHRHWNFRPGTEVSRPDAPEAFLDLLRDSVKLRLRSDVPFGVLLSGGLDSSTVARLAVNETRHPLQCVSLQYPSSPFDESHYTKLVADDPARYHVHWVTPSAQDLFETIGAVVWHHDAPTPMRGRYPQWHVLKAASKVVTVVLGGQGADELLGGYDRFMMPFLRDRLDSRLPNPQSRLSLIGELYRLGQVSDGVHRLLPPRLYAGMANQIGRALRSIGVAHGAPHGANSPTEAPGDRPYRSRVNNALWHELRTVGLPEILHAEDSLSMANSLEARLPFLDHRLVEFCFSLAYQEKIGEGWTKLLLRRATPGILPEPIRLRRHKLGFPGDYGGWMGTGTGLDRVRSLLLDPKCLGRGWQDRKLMQERLGRSRRHAERWVTQNPQGTWRAVTFEIWCRQFLDGDHALRPPLSDRSRQAQSAASVVASGDVV